MLKHKFIYRVSKILQNKVLEERGIIPRSSEFLKQFDIAKLMKRGIVSLQNWRWRWNKNL